MADFRTYNFPEVQLPLLSLEFRPVTLTGVDGSKQHCPFGLVIGPLAVHPARDWSHQDQRTLFRVSHRETGARVADLDDLYLALGFAESLRSLDWSGTVEDIARRNREPVGAALRHWTFAEARDADA